MINNNINIEGARIFLRNFAGKEKQYNPAGKRNFCVALTTDLAEKLTRDGWNVRWPKPNADGDVGSPYLQVAVSFENIPPKIILITSSGQTRLSEGSCEMLDWTEMQNVDLTIRPYNWCVNGQSGVKAYLKTMYVTAVEDEFESKYRDIPVYDEEIAGTCGHCKVCTGNCHHEAD